MTHLVLRDRDGSRAWDVDDWRLLAALAALTAEPETIGEWADALRRYLPNHQFLGTGRSSVGQINDFDETSPWCVIDLVGRTAVAGGGFELPDQHSAFQADSNDHTDGFRAVWIHAPGDWLWGQADASWRETMASRAASRAPFRDTRAVLFGPPLIDFLATELLAAATFGLPSDEAEREATRRIHARWLMTKRDDLAGRTPRSVLLENRDAIDRDLQHRSEQWTMQRSAPPPLSADSFAYRYGGYGTSEIVLYFDLVRALLLDAWNFVREHSAVTPNVLAERLAEQRERWLEAPLEDGSSTQTPRELIDLERRRMPVVSDGSHLFDDCPICQADARGEFGPAFMWFDGHHLELENEFAFSLTDSREEWEAEQEMYAG